MTLWERLDALWRAAGNKTFGALMQAVEAHRQRHDAATFSIALIALSAKMARADGVLRTEEFDAFRGFVDVPPDQEHRVRLVYDLAAEDVAGFGVYARRVAKLYRDVPEVLEDVLGCLTAVALADCALHPGEETLLEEAREAFRLEPATLEQLKATHGTACFDNPYRVLGVEAGAPLEDARRAYRALARQHHPDALQARGVPAEMRRLAEARMAALNAAYERIQDLAAA